MIDFLCAEDLFDYIMHELNYTKHQLVQILGTSVAMVNKWRNRTAIPSQEMYRKMLHFASLMNIDCSAFTMEKYVESALSFTYHDKYTMIENIDYETNRVLVFRSDDLRTEWVDLEQITNKETPLFKCT